MIDLIKKFPSSPITAISAMKLYIQIMPELIGTIYDFPVENDLIETLALLNNPDYEKPKI